MAASDYLDIGSPASQPPPADDKYADIGTPVKAPPTQNWLDRHPTIKGAMEGATSAAGMSVLGKGLMLGAPFTGPAAPLVEGAGAALSAAPLANLALGTVGGGVGGAIREYGKGIPGKDALATTAELATPLVAGGIGKKALESGFGYMSREAEQLAPLARKLGFNIETGMAREAGKEAASLNAAKMNRDIANKLVSEKTGYPTDSITKKYLEDVVGPKKLGAEFEKVYSPSNTFTFEPKNFETLTNKLLEEASSGDQAFSPRVRRLAIDLVGGEGNFERLKLAKEFATENPAIQKQIVDKVMSQMGPRKITGDVLQRVREAFSGIAYKSTSGTERHAAGEIVDMIDNAVKADSPEVAEKLAEIRPKYRAAKTLQKLHEGGHIPEGNVSLEALGKQVAGEKEHPYELLGQIGQTFGMKSIGETPVTKGFMQSMKKIPSAIVSPVVNSRMGQGIQGALTPVLREPGTFPYAATLGGGITSALQGDENK